MIHIFIINPYAGKKNFANDLRSQLDSIEGLNYFVFSTRYAGYETELVKKILHIFEGERLRFYCCGGSGTMRNMLNGFDDLSRAEIAFYPCGLSNDFLKMFGDQCQRFYNIEELINGDIIKVDYIASNCGVSLNSLSTGLDSNCLEMMDCFRAARIINDDLPYTLATLYSIFVSKTEKYEVTLDDEVYKGGFAEVFIGNGCVFGGKMHFAEHTVVNDGEALFALAGNRRGVSLLPTLMAVTGKKHEKVKKLMTCGSCSRIRIKRLDGSLFTINQDGDLQKNVNVCEARIVRQGLNLVVPKGVTVV